MRIRACVLASAVIVAWQAPAAAGDPAIAREQLKIGYALAEQGKCDEALPHLVESLRLDAKAITLINLADCEEKVGRLSDAMSHWIDARSRAQTEGARAIEDEAERRASTLEPRLARLTIVLAEAAPKDATIERDGVVLGAPSLGIPLPMNPGPHALVIKARGRPDRTIEITLAEGEAKRLEVDAAAERTAPVEAKLPESSKGGGFGPLVFAGFGVAVAGVAAGTITGLMAMSAGSRARTSCPERACDRAALDEVEAGRALGTISTVSFVVAGAGAAVGLYGVIWGGKGADRAAGSSVGVAIAPAGVSLGGRF